MVLWSGFGFESVLIQSLPGDDNNHTGFGFESRSGQSQKQICGEILRSGFRFKTIKI